MEEDQFIQFELFELAEVPNPNGGTMLVNLADAAQFLPEPEPEPQPKLSRRKTPETQEE
jgi:hypothetical protein